ncbi:DUF4920 domain-containing protein [Wenzhouxiangella sp. AB-CW3]|uniref:DUF4920 domain-containing protein n=1 Tax=Wenzhouxiangella sp. AB-CW3 TaxID=2771012 RepID=UPI00168C1002|nr:DUF4920 domain-containing protein [Wenzhouxiangella sp. AB-CW3]QOC22522.1 DUF4920 domain-containing protein [Wenzhouxiangella sp. AB-CW3]
MKVSVWLTVLMVAGMMSAATWAGTWYGETGDAAMETQSVAEVMADPDAWLDKPLMVSGRITDVCTHRGCWAVLEEDGHMLRIQTLDHAFEMPADARSMARAHGVLERLEDDDGDSTADEPAYRYRLDASGIYIE